MVEDFFIFFEVIPLLFIAFISTILSPIFLSYILCKPMTIHRFKLKDGIDYQTTQELFYNLPFSLSFNKLVLLFLVLNIILILLAIPLETSLSYALLFLIPTLLMLLFAYQSFTNPTYEPVKEDYNEYYLNHIIFPYSTVEGFKTEKIGYYNPISNSINIKGISDEEKEKLIKRIKKLLPPEEISKNFHKINNETLDVNNLVIIRRYFPVQKSENKFMGLSQYYIGNIVGEEFKGLYLGVSVDSKEHMNKNF